LFVGLRVIRSVAPSGEGRFLFCRWGRDRLGAELSILMVAGVGVWFVDLASWFLVCLIVVAVLEGGLEVLWG